jgi:hypothetical protein
MGPLDADSFAVSDWSVDVRRTMGRLTVPGSLPEWNKKNTRKTQGDSNPSPEGVGGHPLWSFPPNSNGGNK